MQICRGKIRKAKLQNETWLGRNRKGNDTAPWAEEQGEGQGCATAQREGTAFRCTTEINQNVKYFFLSAFTEGYIMYFDFSKADDVH